MLAAVLVDSPAATMPPLDAADTTMPAKIETPDLAAKSAHADNTGALTTVTASPASTNGAELPNALGIGIVLEPDRAVASIIGWSPPPESAGVAAPVVPSAAGVAKSTNGHGTVAETKPLTSSVPPSTTGPMTLPSGGMPMVNPMMVQPYPYFNAPSASPLPMAFPQMPFAAQSPPMMSQSGMGMPLYGTTPPMPMPMQMNPGAPPPFYMGHQPQDVFNQHMLQHQAAQVQANFQVQQQQALVQAQVAAANSAAQAVASSSGMPSGSLVTGVQPPSPPLDSNNPLCSFLKPSYLSTMPNQSNTPPVLSHLNPNLTGPPDCRNAYNPYALPAPITSHNGFIQTFGAGASTMMPPMMSQPPPPPNGMQPFLPHPAFPMPNYMLPPGYPPPQFGPDFAAAVPIAKPTLVAQQSIASAGSQPSKGHKRKHDGKAAPSPPAGVGLPEHSLLTLLDASHGAPSASPPASSPSASSKRSRTSRSGPPRVNSEDERGGRAGEEEEEEDDDSEEYTESADGRNRAGKSSGAANGAPANMAALIAASLEPETDSVNGGVQYVCRFAGCGDVFKTRFSLKRHLKKHSGEKPFLCTYEGCNKRFAEKSTLKRHVRIHTGEKPYHCSFAGCGKFFADRTNVKRHEAIHSGSRPYWCTHCSRGYFWKKHLRKHMLAVHKRELESAPGDTEEEPDDEDDDDDISAGDIEELDRENTAVLEAAKRKPKHQL